MPHSHRMKLIILDRDGVLNQPREDFVKSPEEWQPIEGSMDAVAFLKQADYTVVIASNQSGISRRYLTMQDLNEIHDKLHRSVREAGGSIDGIWFCPHTEAADCNCRKPKTGMIDDILSRFNTQAQGVYLVGDSLRDLQAIHAVGGIPVLVLTGKGQQTQASGGLPEGTQIFDDLLAFAKHLNTLCTHGHDTP